MNNIRNIYKAFKLFQLSSIYNLLYHTYLVLVWNTSFDNQQFIQKRKKSKQKPQHKWKNSINTALLSYPQKKSIRVHWTLRAVTELPRCILWSSKLVSRHSSKTCKTQLRALKQDQSCFDSMLAADKTELGNFWVMVLVWVCRLWPFILIFA